MKKTFLTIAAAAIVLYTSCEVDAIIDPWAGVPQCQPAIPQMDFVGSIDNACGATGAVLHVNDTLYTDFGQNEYWLDLQYRNAQGQFVCAMLPELAPFRFMLTGEQVTNSRFKVRRLTYTEDGVLWQRVESGYYFFNTCNLTQQ
jgi:hypothetical protein